jgi:hypothetical protein
VTKKVLWAVAAVGAGAIIAMLYSGYPQVGPGTEGTVGGAKRATSAQSGTIALGSMDVQQFLQTDTFDRLTRNESTRSVLEKAAKDTAFRAALTNPAFQAAMAEAAFQKALAEPAFLKALAEPAFAAMAEPACGGDGRTRAQRRWLNWRSKGGDG